MLQNIFKKFFQTRNQKILNGFGEIIKKINFLENSFEKLSDIDLRNKTFEFKKKLKVSASLDDILPEAFAVVREASKRVFNMRHFDVQLLGGIALHRSYISEMRTGEGKTLTSTLPAYLNALCGKGVHIVTMNDYLAKRDAEKNKILFEFLGLSVGININGMNIIEKRKAYLSDITYGTNHEYGFDYLKDNMIFEPKEKIQRSLYYALIDEVDSILIDEARTPLIISGPTEKSNDFYKKINHLTSYFILQKQAENVDFLKSCGDFYIDRKNKQVFLTELGFKKFEKLLVKNNFICQEKLLYSVKFSFLIHHLLLALKANFIYFRNVDYIVKNNSVIIVDEHTGRIMLGRRWSDGLHQAIEAKENVTIQNENQTLASITIQNYFRLYKKLSGMTGTAQTESFEFSSIYNLDTVSIPTNKPMIRKDFPDMVFLTEKEKINAIVLEIKSCISRKQPVLVGTVSIEKSEMISSILSKMNISHNILNAKFPEQEAKIISQAGTPGAVTIATNMAGRGTDILLGGNFDKKNVLEVKENIVRNKISDKNYFSKWHQNHEIVLKSGGLHIIGTERHESRRIDNQLRGRSGRQGDPGTSRFYLSLEDSLIRLFTSQDTIDFIKKIGIKVNQAIEHPWINYAIENAQKKVELQNFEIRKHLLEYDDISNLQRKVIYCERNKILHSKEIRNFILNIIEDIVIFFVEKNIFTSCFSSKDVLPLEKDLQFFFQYHNSLFDILDEKPFFYQDSNKFKLFLVKNIKNFYITQVNSIDYKCSFLIEKLIVMQILDHFWREHLNSMEFLKQFINFQGYAQKDPKQEYQIKSFHMFNMMLLEIKKNIVIKLFRVFFINFKNTKNIFLKFFNNSDLENLNFFIMNQDYFIKK